MDEDIAEQIAEFLKEIHDSKSDVIEIGPGEGVLTKYFHSEEWSENYHLCEIDNRLIDKLKTDFPLFAARLINADIIKLNLLERFSGSLILFGNFPYNISSQIVFKMLENMEQVDCLIGMFQKEVSERICSIHGSKSYGILSVLVNAYYDSEYLLDVPENAFDPPPRVKSAVIRLRRHPDKFEIKSDKKLKMLVKKTFGLRRKKISNSSKGIQFTESEFTAECMEKRPEQLSVEDYVALSNQII